MTYGLYKHSNKIRKIRGNPRSLSNQKGLIVWTQTKKGVQSWIKEWGTKSQKEKYL
jgi:hypothetical protein